MAKLCIEDLTCLDMFAHLREETLEKMCNLGIKKSVVKGEHIFRDKEKEENIYVVLSGKVSLYKINESSQKRVIFILGREKIVNEVILDDLPASVSCEVFEDGEVLCFNRNKFIDIMRDDFELTTRVINSLAKKVRRTYRQLKNATPIKMEKRVAAKLWKLCKDYGVEKEYGTLIDLNISITYLADMFGTPRETISRAMKVLQQNNLVKVQRKQIIIPEPEKLIKYFKEIGKN